MEVLPVEDPVTTTAAAAAAAAAPGDDMVQSPRTKRLVTNLLQRVFSLERLLRRGEAAVAVTPVDEQQCNGSGGAAAAAAAAAAERRKCPYSALEKNPSCPYVFQMPLHYPRFSREEYEAMPEWQLDRLLEEYGIPLASLSSLRDKREYAVGAFLWRN